MGKNLVKSIGLLFVAAISVILLMSCEHSNTAVKAPVETPGNAVTSSTPTENKTAPAIKSDPGSKPGRASVRISDRIGSRDPNSADCEYYIKVQNLHDRWSLINVAVDINGTIYPIADVIRPGGTAEFYRPSLPRPQTSYHVYYDWKPPD